MNYFATCRKISCFYTQLKSSNLTLLENHECNETLANKQPQNHAWKHSLNTSDMIT